MGKRSLFTASVILAVLCFANAGNEQPQMQLPQKIQREAVEENLKCLFEVLRQFDYQRTEILLPKIEHLYNHINPGLDRSVDLNTLLLQWYDLQDIDDRDTGIKFQPRKAITECNLNLAPALGRCSSAYQGMPCEQVEYGPGEYNKAPFVVVKCPNGFQRYGCCKCLRSCTYTDSIEPDVEMGEDPTNASRWTNTNNCVKKPSLKSMVKKGNDKQQIGLLVGQWEILEETDGEFVFVEECAKDFKRVGNRECIALCPLGWPDMGRKCLKQGELVYFPFVWQPGDGKVEAKAGAASPAPRA
jgi:hypothetical protein